MIPLYWHVLGTVSLLKNVILEGSFTTPAYLSPECTHLIKAILRRKPEARLSLETQQAASAILAHSLAAGCQNLADK